jgi:hypothetical protein
MQIRSWSAHSACRGCSKLPKQWLVEAHGKRTWLDSRWQEGPRFLSTYRAAKGYPNHDPHFDRTVSRLHHWEFIEVTRSIPAARLLLSGWRWSATPDKMISFSAPGSGEWTLQDLTIMHAHSSFRFQSRIDALGSRGGLDSRRPVQILAVIVIFNG